jgi:hypothetical protein
MEANHRDASHIGDHLRAFPSSSISKLAPHCALILSIVLIFLFFIKFYVLELFVLRRLYGSKYTQLGDINRRGFVNHHVAAASKIVVMVLGLYPFFSVTFGSAHFDSPYAPGVSTTLGDILVICTQIFVGTFIFELIYRVKISPVSVAHHVGTILIGQAAITLSVNGNVDGGIEFVLCTVYGMHLFPETFPVCADLAAQPPLTSL